jgi:hypothetical protein
VQNELPEKSSHEAASIRLPNRRASLPALGAVNSSSSVSSSQIRSEGASNFANFNTAEFFSTTSAPAVAASQAVVGATVVRPSVGRLELNAKKVQVQKAIGDSESTGALLSKFALPVGATSAWLYDPLPVSEGAALIAQLKNHARSITCFSFSSFHTELLHPMLAGMKLLHSLTHINITSQIFTRGVAQQFVAAIEDMRNLSHVSLCSAHLSDDILSVLLPSLSTHRAITFVKLCDNNITAEGFSSILKALPRLTGLELDANPISSKFCNSLSAIQEGFSGSQMLSWLSLLQTGIAVNEIDQLIQHLMQMEALDNLALDVTPRELFDVIIKKGSGNAQFRFPPSCFVDAGWSECLWSVRKSTIDAICCR